MQGELRINPAAEPTDKADPIRGRAVTYVGQLASMTAEQFRDVIETHGGRYSFAPARGVSVVVIGERNWPITRSGDLQHHLRRLRIGKRLQNWGTQVLAERAFLDLLGLRDYRENISGLYTISTLVSLLSVTPTRVRSWVAAGLIRPAHDDRGVWYFDFLEVAAAKTILDVLAKPGVTLGKLRRSFERLRNWMPDADRPLAQVALLERDGELLVRLRSGEIAAPDGQLRFEFQPTPAPEKELHSTAAEPEYPPMRLVPAGPRLADEWIEQAAEQEHAGYLADAADSYRQALLSGGPDADVCFSLANVLSQLGERDAAIERYRQAVEIRQEFVDAWNNLGVCLTELDQHEAAIDAFQKAVRHAPDDARARWNLADALDELGRTTEAAVHWREFLRYDSSTPHAAHARRRLAAS